MLNETCRKELAQDSPSLFQNGKLDLQPYHIGWIISGSFAIISTITSLWLINRHLQWYTCKREQRYIVRILFMVPLYALISFASFLFWNHSTPLLLVRDGYESTVLTAFFYLLLIYISPDVEEQKSIFLKLGLSREADNEARRKGQEVRKWIFPLGSVRWKPTDGLYFLQLMKWGVLQYCAIRPITTLIAVILDYTGLYCEESWGLRWGHIYISSIVAISVTVAMYCLIQLYVSVRANLAPHKPLLKLFAIKAVVFLTFWQATLLSLLDIFGVVKDTQYMTAADINIGIGSLLETFEMMLFAFLHLRAFTYEPYRPFISCKSINPPEKTPRLRSLGHALDFRETLREIWSGCLYMAHKIRGKEPMSDVGAKRVVYYTGAFGRSRAPVARKTEIKVPEHEREPAYPIKVEIEEQVDVDIGDERQWLGLGDNYGYGLRYFQRERSDELEVQVKRELERRGYTPYTEGLSIDTQALPQVAVSTEERRQRPWWRSTYDRISRPSQKTQRGSLDSPSTQSRRLSKSVAQRPLTYGEAELGLLSYSGHDLDDLPPPSIIQMYHRERRDIRNPTNNGEDVLAALPVLDRRQPKQVSEMTIPSSKHDGTLALHYPASPSAAYSTPVQTPARTDSLFGRVFQSNSSSSHEAADFDAPHGQSRRSPVSIPSIREYEFGVTRESVVSQSLFGYNTIPNGLRPTAEVMTSVRPHSEMSNISRSDSSHRREAAPFHPSFPSSSAPSISPITPVRASNLYIADTQLHGPTQSR